MGLRWPAVSMALHLANRSGRTDRAPFAGSSVARSKLLQEVSRRNEVARLETLRKSVEDRAEKFERFVSLGSISPESCEADAATQFIGEQSPLPRKLKRLQQTCLALVCVLGRRCEDFALHARQLDQLEYATAEVSAQVTASQIVLYAEFALSCLHKTLCQRHAQLRSVQFVAVLTQSCKGGLQQLNSPRQLVAARDCEATLPANAAARA